jgi:flagellar hook-basal body complex protein FliE
MAIAPITVPVAPVSGNTPGSGAIKAGNPASMFEDLLKSAVQNANASEAEARTEAMKIATGSSDNLHTLAINSAKAELALSALVQTRNKALDAYNEIMRITL